ncbi:carboxylesterase family protein [Peredibacter starrii]|uniref:Carboxylic ester hydrolase n=1 Tax=Peredibacter starrii TaxID=28202 RepID=A0AAX4HIY2_9BACT|nr:carboxylesterase family protein [Peredibacter starrii]WPU63205.1 carboxylesterase family protein [Peredibacter starrii]
MKTLFLFSFLISLSTFAAPAPLVQSEGTTFIGLNGPNDTEAYFGIPYAQAPVGNLRWKAPKKIRLGQRVVAQRMGPVCAQLWNMFSNVSPDYEGQAVGSEDCLYLNVWKPRQNANYKRPVFFWIHGGSNTKGTANDPNYDGAWFAQHNDAIFVSVNYRLGLFASFIHPSLETGNKLDSAGNHVTLDLIMALNWVKNNIENFGGDPDNVVIAGQSAGCMNVWGLLQSPLAKNLFNGAICSAGLPNAYPKLVIEERSDNLLHDLLIADKIAKDADEAKEWVRKQGPQTVRKYLLSKSAAELLAIPRFIVPTQHVSDGTVLPFDGLASVMTGRYNRVPMILGSTIDEATYLVGATMFKPTEGDLFRMLNSGRSYPRSAIIKDEYLSTFDGITRSSSIGLSNSLESISQSLRPFNWNIYKYEFTWKETPEPWKSVFGAFHGLDAIFYLGNFVEDRPQFARFAWRPSNKESREALREHMSQYFKSFLHHGNPNEGHNGKEWRSFSGSGHTFKF